MHTGLPQQIEENKEIKTEFDYELICGVPIAVKQLGYVNPLTIKEIGSIGLSKYQKYLSLITLDKDILEIKKDIDMSEIRAFDILAENSKQDKEFKILMEEALSSVMKEKVTFIEEYSVFVIGTMEELDKATEENPARIIHRENFEQIVYLVQLQNKIKVKEKINKKKLSPKAQMLANKREIGRKMIAQSRGQGDITMDNLISALGVFTKDLNKVLDWTIYQLHDQYDTFMRHENYKNKYEQYLVGEDPKKLNLEKHWTMK